VLLELTVPWKDRLKEAFERKLSKYAGLVSNCQKAGWKARCLPMEVGCRGFAACSLARAFSNLGIEEEKKRRAIRSTTDAAERAWRRVYDVERPETPEDSRNITEDVSRSISRCIHTVILKGFYFELLYQNVLIDTLGWSGIVCDY